MDATAPAAPADRFASIIDGLCRAIAARGTRLGLGVPLLLLLWSRLRRTSTNLSALAARVAAGKMRRPAKSRRRPASPSRPPVLRLPRGHAWLVRMLPEAAAGYGSQLQHLLAQPDMVALLEAAPQARRLLNPLCRMLGVPPPPGRPAPPPAPTPAAAPAAAPADPIPDAAAPRHRTSASSPGLAPRPARHACGPPVPA